MPKPAFAAFKNAGNAAPIACGGTLDSGVPQVTINSPTDGQLYLDELPVSISATDDQGVTDIDVIVDGKEVGLKTVRSGKGATVKFDWGGARNLSYGPHTFVATASDEAKNVGRAVAKIIHVGGGKYPYKVPTTFKLSVGKVKNGKVLVKGKIASAKPLVSRTGARPRLHRLLPLRHQVQALEAGQPLQQGRQDRLPAALRASTSAACGASRASSSRRPATRARARRRSS